MSVAQRRTNPEGIGTVPSPFPQDAMFESADGTVSRRPTHPGQRRDSAFSNEANNPVENGKEVWQALSYDPFSQTGPPSQPHYESFSPELPDNVAAYEVSTTRRICQVAFAVVACVFASGIVCGFAALKPILIKEGVYASLCQASYVTNDESEIPCPEQDMRLNLFFITASITLNVSTVLAGYVLDNYGRRVCYLLSALILFLGGTCMAAAFHFGEKLAGFDGYITGNVLLGLGGTFLFVSSYQLSNAFPRHSGLIVALVTGAFDASAAVFLFYHLAYKASSGRFHPAYFFLLFALFIPSLILVAEFALMSDRPYTTRREYQDAIARAQDDTRDVHDSDDELPSPTRAREQRAMLREARLQAIETVTGDAEARDAHRMQVKDRQAASGVQGILSGLDVRAQMATPWFVLLLLLTVTQMTRMNYFIATVRAQYRYLLGGDEEAAERVNGVFDVALPVAGVVTTPFIGVLLNTMPVWATMGVLTGLVVLLGVLNCVPGSEAAAYAAVVAFVLYRPLYYSAVSDYATKVFGFATFGRIYGTVICVSGLGQFMQPALDALTHGPLHENPIPLNIAFAISGSVIGAALTLYVYVKTRENEAGTEEERRGLLRDRRESDGYSGI
ncbi:hypothetical protein N0V82_009246 [Gnomoniopsis sp. IMI 355080]|nr:hypothetical protein N0V82_009246 [Gnomoniopsis sp. IMI 355080]